MADSSRARPVVRGWLSQGRDEPGRKTALHGIVQRTQRNEMPDFNCHTALEVSGAYSQVKRFFDEYCSLTTEHDQSDGGGAALDLDLACPIPPALKGTEVNETVKSFHALYVMPPSDLQHAPHIYRENRSRRKIEARLEALHPGVLSTVRKTAARLHREVYSQYGALDETGWSRRFRGCVGNTYCRRGGDLEGDERGVTLRCCFNTEVGWPRPVLVKLARTHADLRIWADIETWAGERLTFHGLAGRFEVRQVIPPLPEHVIE